MDLAALLGRGLSDHLSLVERVVDQVVDQVSVDETFVATGETPTERIAVAIGNRLARMILDEDASTDRGRSVDDQVLAHYDELVERNLALASALGACDCWGESPQCLICDGDGVPGWLPPDRELYTTYVEPVVRAVTRAPTAGHGGTNGHATTSSNRNITGRNINGHNVNGHNPHNHHNDTEHEENEHD